MHVVMFPRSSVDELPSLRSKKLKLWFIRPEHPIPLVSRPILALPCKFKSFHLIQWFQQWFLYCTSAMETCCNQPSVHSAGWDVNVQACSHFISQLLTWFCSIMQVEQLFQFPNLFYTYTGRGVSRWNFCFCGGLKHFPTPTKEWDWG